MKKYILKAGGVCAYLLLIAVFVDFHPEKLWNWKEVLLVLLGVCLLSLPYYRRELSRGKFSEIISKNGMTAAYFVILILILKRALQEPAQIMSQEILICFRPLLYGFFIMVLFRQEAVKTRAFVPGAAEEQEGQEKTSKTATLEAYCRERGLTQREIEIAKLVLLGLSNREIGEMLYIAESTVKKHLSHIFEKLEVKNREQLKQCFKKL